MEHASQSNEGKRPYHSRVRQRQAEDTHRRIIAAARSLFTSRGYAATTLEAIAEVADVSPKTLGAVFGSKRVLLAEVINPDAFSTRLEPNTATRAGGADHSPGLRATGERI